MTVDTPLKKLARSAAEETGPTPSALPLLIDLLFADKSLSFWHALKQPMKGLINEEDVSRQLTDLTPPLEAIGKQLRDAVNLDETALASRLINVLHTLENNRGLFFLPHATADERITRLPLFTPMAVLHLSILSFLHTLAYENSVQATAYIHSICHTTARHYLAYAQQAVSDALAWRTGQLDITCTPMRSARFGGPNLQITCVDAHTHQTIVDEMCTAYPGVRNPLLQRTVDRVTLYEERLHHNAALFWEMQVLDVLDEWSEERTEMKMPEPPDIISGALDDALYLIFQDIGRSMQGLS